MWKDLMFEKNDVREKREKNRHLLKSKLNELLESLKK